MDFALAFNGAGGGLSLTRSYHHKRSTRGGSPCRVGSFLTHQAESNAASRTHNANAVRRVAARRIEVRVSAGCPQVCQRSRATRARTNGPLNAIRHQQEQRKARTTTSCGNSSEPHSGQRAGSCKPRRAYPQETQIRISGDPSACLSRSSPILQAQLHS